MSSSGQGQISSGGTITVAGGGGGCSGSAGTMTVWITGGSSGGGGGGASSPATFVPGQWHAVSSGQAHFPGSYHRLRHVKYLPNTMGWRYFGVDPDGCLVSPAHYARWEDGELRAKEWNKDMVVRGAAGIHALLAPEMWRHLHVDQFPEGAVTALVERFGHYVLGEDGWRAEWVVIREITAPSKDLAAKIRKFYPDIPVHCDEDETQQEIDNGYRKGHRDRAEGSPDIPASADDGSNDAGENKTIIPLSTLYPIQTTGTSAGLSMLQTKESLVFNVLRAQRNAGRARIAVLIALAALLLNVGRLVAMYFTS
jgi:hypothetical protein